MPSLTAKNVGNYLLNINLIKLLWHYSQIIPVIIHSVFTECLYTVQQPVPLNASAPTKGQFPRRLASAVAWPRCQAPNQRFWHRTRLSLECSFSTTARKARTGSTRVPDHEARSQTCRAPAPPLWQNRQLYRTSRFPVGLSTHSQPHPSEDGRLRGTGTGSSW